MFKFLLFLTFITLSFQQANLSECSKGCLTQAATAATCPVTAGIPKADCFCDDQAETYEPFWAELDMCENDNNCTDYDELTTYLDGVCATFTPATTSTSVKSTATATASTKSGSSTATATGSVKSSSASSTGTATASTKSGSASSTVTGSASTKTTQAATSSTTSATIKPTDLGTPQYFALNSSVSKGPLYLSCSDTNCQLQPSGSNVVPIRQVCASSNCQTYMLVPSGANPECITVSGPGVKLAPCAVTVPALNRRQQIPTSQLWRVDAKNTILSAAASSASSGCLAPSGAASPGTVVNLGSCNAESAWVQSANPLPGPAPSGGLSGGAIAGIVVGSLAGVALIAGGGYGIYKATQKKNAQKLNLAENDLGELPMQTAQPTVLDTRDAPVSVSYEKEAPRPIDPVYTASAPDAYVPAAAAAVSTGMTTDSTQGTATVVRAYNPRYADELELRPGDQVRIEEVFPDGWGKGYNMTTKLSGVFPMNFVSKA